MNKFPGVSKYICGEIPRATLCRNPEEKKIVSISRMCS